MAENVKILIVDDEIDLCDILCYNLEKEGYECDMAHSAEEVLIKDSWDYSLIILDVMMDKISGFELAETLRKKKKITIPIIFITAKDSENDLLKGFASGGDDYIKKPFSIKEVIVRVQAILSRTKQDSTNLKRKEIHKGFILDQEKKRVIIKGEKINLTPKEYEVLRLLLNHPGSVFSRNDILKKIWETEFVVDRTVDVTITRLRKKIGPFRKMIVSRSGFGYSYEPNE